ncbi:Lsr2 family protein [Microbacterium sp. HSID17254]|uniref:histone-like nucleoid-structuring protein Lsr2 n=1 Tax=Microbacterium sp. HSID17254 TaxID=2419509 RepID=UPI000F8787EF|nr:Lsr2 family protein [Microbacterium sp. HSID17254]
MARIEHVTLVDDLDGSSADETVEFVMDAVTYEIDLSTSNASALRDALAPFVAAARRPTSAAAAGMTRGRRPGGAGSTATTEQREHNKAIREWARTNGYTIAARGRIPAEVVDGFNENAGRSGSTPGPRATASQPQFREAG